MQGRALLFVSALATLGALGCAPETRIPEEDRASRANDIPARVQWEANYGYCGEVSLVSASLFFGAYLSQFDARALASPGVPQQREDSQLLLGVNDAAAARAVHLRSERWSGDGTANFLVWVKQHVGDGAPVAIGLYTNEARFYGAKSPEAGDPEYDHIVPVVAVHSTHDDAAYHGDDTLTFSDNGLWSADDDHLFTVSFDAIQATRAEANAKSAAVYSLASARRNYGIALLGRDMDEDASVRVDTSVAFEHPSMVDGSSTRPAAAPIELTIRASALASGHHYVLERFDDFAKYPDAPASRRPFEAGPDAFVTTETIQSDEIAMYRAVRLD